MEKAYSGDVVKIIKESGTMSCKLGDVFTVNFRQSDLGACDDDFVTLENNEVVSDDEYVIVEKVNTIHFHKELNEVLLKVQF